MNNTILKGEYDFSVQPQISTVIAMTDALFGGVKTRKPTIEDRLDEVIALANRMELLCGKLAQELPSECEAALEQCQDFASDSLINLAGVRRMLADMPAPCACGKCDECVARRSDEHYDRKRDWNNNAVPA